YLSCSVGRIFSCSSASKYCRTYLKRSENNCSFIETGRGLFLSSCSLLWKLPSSSSLLNFSCHFAQNFSGVPLVAYAASCVPMLKVSCEYTYRLLVPSSC